MLILYSVAIFLSAFLLFLIQPMVGKMILPVVGGSASAWINCLFFFQTTLLAGYAYAHFGAKILGVRIQAILHLLLAALASLWLPVQFATAGSATANPSLWILNALFNSVAMPFFILAALSPIIQVWFGNSQHSRANNPFFLFAASNLGSFTALIVYPTLIEPHLNLDRQAELWKLLYILLWIILITMRLAHKPAPKTTETEAHLNQMPAVKENLPIKYWLIAAMIPSSMLLAVTRFITTDIAPMPLLWVIPLLIYLATFVSAFSDFRLSHHIIEKCLLAAVLIFPALFFYFATHLAFAVPAHLFILFAVSMYCHAWLADNRPAVKDLTIYYLYISLGGVLGSLFVSILAPALFNNDAEYPILILAACYLIRHFPLICNSEDNGPKENIGLSLSMGLYVATAFILVNVANFSVIFHQNAIAAGISASDNLSLQTVIFLSEYNQQIKALLMTIIAVFPIYFIRKMPAISLPMFSLACITVLGIWHIGHGEVRLESARNFFGSKTVIMSAQEKSVSLKHGSTSHGTQSLLVEKMHEPLSYYHRNGPAGSIFDMKHLQKSDLKATFIGLGIGAMLAYAQDGQHFTFIEIDPQVIELASNPDYFTYVSSYADRHSIIPGDGRKELEKATDNLLDLVFVDAFSSDSIPVHLITVEAVNMYFKKLKADGLIVLHVTNRYLDLKSMLGPLAREIGCQAIFALDNNFDKTAYANAHRSSSEYVVLSRNHDLITQLASCRKINWQPLPINENTKQIRAWRDNSSSILPVLDL